MYEDKYIELEKLKKKNTIGTIIIIAFFILVFLAPFILNMYPDLININTYDPSFYIVIAIITIIVVFILVYYKLCTPYNRLVRELTSEIKKQLVKRELNNIFNNTYLETDPILFDSKLKELNIKRYSSQVNDSFSATYNKVKFHYADVRLYHHSDDSTVTDFCGPVFEFNLKKEIEGDLYISRKEKILFGYSSDIDSLLRSTEIKEIKPNNNILNDNIIIKSNTNPSIIDNSSFQEIINELMNKNRYIFIYTKNKLYVLVYNYNNLFEIQIKNKQSEIKAEEQIRKEVNILREDLDAIIRYKDVLNIKDESF